MKKLLGLFSFIFLLFPTTSLAAPPQDQCPNIISKSELSSLVGESGVFGYTVFQGISVSSFPVEIIAVQNGYGDPENIIIWARAGGPEIAEIGGPARGMSGSPIYTEDGRLIGALAYGISTDTNVFGITPAYDMVSALPSSPALDENSLPEKIETRWGTAQPLSVPVQTNMNGFFYDKLKKRFASLGVDFSNKIPPIATKGSVSPLPGASISAGDTLIGALSWGRSSAASLGTATYVCGDEVLGFGHPLVGDPNSRGILANGDVYAMIKGANPFVPAFKLGDATTVLGTMSQDNDFGIGGTVGSLTETISLSGRVNDFSGPITEIAQIPINNKSSLARIVPEIAGAALDREIAATNDYQSQYISTTGGWEIKGSSSAGPFTVKNKYNAWTGPDTSAGIFGGLEPFGPPFDLYKSLNRLIGYGFGAPKSKLTIDSVEVNFDVEEGYRLYSFSDYKIKVGSGAWSGNAARIKKVKKGQSFSIKLIFADNTGGSIQRVIKFKATGKSPSVQISEAPFSQRKINSLRDLTSFLETPIGNKLFLKTKKAKYISGSLRFDRVIEEVFVSLPGKSNNKFGFR